MNRCWVYLWLTWETEDQCLDADAYHRSPVFYYSCKWFHGSVIITWLLYLVHHHTAWTLLIGRVDSDISRPQPLYHTFWLSWQLIMSWLAKFYDLYISCHLKFCCSPLAFYYISVWHKSALFLSNSYYYYNLLGLSIAINRIFNNYWEPYKNAAPQNRAMQLVEIFVSFLYGAIVDSKTVFFLFFCVCLQHWMGSKGVLSRQFNLNIFV